MRVPDGDSWFVGPADAPRRYEMLEHAAAGGEGEVWRAREVHGNGAALEYAVKIIDAGAADAAGRLDELRLQAGLATHLEHPALVKVRETFLGPAPAGEPGQRLYFVMKWISGRGMQDALESGELRGLDAVEWLVPIADALDHLHSGRDTNGVPVLHRDVKPSNIVRSHDGRIYLIDFGLLRMRRDPLTSRIAGTAPFMAPESLARGEYGPASDRYTLGATLYYALTGETPIPGDDTRTAERLAAALGPTISPADRERVTRGLLAMLEVRPDRRPESAGGWIRALVSAPPATSRSGPPAPPEYPRPTSGYPSTADHPPPTDYPMPADYPMPPTVYPPPGGRPWGAPGLPGVPGVPGAPGPKKKRTGLFVGLGVGLTLVLVACCGLPWLASRSDRDGTAGSTPTRTVDRSTPPPPADKLAAALVTPRDAIAATGSNPEGVTTDKPDAMVGLTPFELCDKGPVAGDAIGTQDSNGIQVLGTSDDVDISSAVAGFYGRYAGEYFQQVKAHAQKCGWQEFSVPKLGDESYAVFGEVWSPTKTMAGLVVVRSGQSLLLLAVGSYGEPSSYQRFAITMATRMAARLPKAAR